MTRNTDNVPMPEHLAGRSVVLVGLMGAGKTSIGRRLAARLGLPFRDADTEIEAAAGATVPEIFDRFGEAEFRSGERRVIARLLAGDPLVLATGGGAYMDEQTRATIRREAVCIWLRARLPTLLRRVAGRSHRPLLNGGDPAEVMQRLMTTRHPIYAEADIIVDCGDENPDATTGHVLDALLAWQPARRLRVALASASYDVVVGDNLLARAGALLAPVLPQKRAFVVTDENVAARHLPMLLAGLAETGFSVVPITVAAGETSKSLATFGEVTDQILEAGVERRTAVIALGGGVVGDLAGYAAASTLRGLPFVQVPTTLLAQVDSSVGGKTGINTRYGKNLLGAFHQPRMVLADTATLATLPVRELRAGYAEIAKAGLIGDAAFFSWCEANGGAVVGGERSVQAEAVLRACAFKAQVVGDDEREEKSSDGRALLNLGHTFGHALEAELGFGTILHGEAVAIGIGLAFRLSANLGLCAPADAERVIGHFAAVGMEAELPMLNRRLSADRLIAHMRRDKKAAGRALEFCAGARHRPRVHVKRRAGGRGGGAAARRGVRGVGARRTGREKGGGARRMAIARECAQAARRRTAMIVVHHLNRSRSLRVLWLLEELQVPYEVRRYQRDPKTMLAPPELKAVHPLGKSPVLGDGDRVVAETGAIIEYLVERHGNGRLVPAPGSDARLRYTYWLHYAEGSAMPPLLLKLVLDRMETGAPFLLRPVLRGAIAKVRAGFLDPQLKTHLDYMERSLDTGEWFAGAEFSAADIAMSFPLEVATSRAGLDQSRPKLFDWLQRIHARPAYQRARERGGE